MQRTASAWEEVRFTHEEAMEALRVHYGLPSGSWELRGEVATSDGGRRELRLIMRRDTTDPCAKLEAQVAEEGK